MKRNIWKYVVCAALLLGAGQAAKAQESEEAPKYHLGVKVGYAETNVWHDLHLDGHSEWNCQSFMAGVSFDTRLIRKPLYLETGLYGSNRGVDVIDGTRRFTKNNFSLMVPVMLSYHFYPTYNLGIEPFFGPFAAYNCGFEQMDYGLRLGCGINYRRICFNFGFDFGLKDHMFDNKEGFYEHDGMLTSFFVTLGWNFLGNR